MTMEDRYTIEFECLACKSVVCLHSEVDLLRQLAYLSTSKCPGCGGNGYIWRLNNIHKNDDDDNARGKEVSDDDSGLLN